MKEPRCGDCKHFRQHYVKWGSGHHACGCGHCVHPRLKHKKPDALACVHFVKKEKSQPAPEW